VARIGPPAIGGGGGAANVVHAPEGALWATRGLRRLCDWAIAGRHCDGRRLPRLPRRSRRRSIAIEEPP
jgi:hypothetical protein